VVASASLLVNWQSVPAIVPHSRARTNWPVGLHLGEEARASVGAADLQHFSLGGRVATHSAQVVDGAGAARLGHGRRQGGHDLGLGW
jgi:hypothetical protein